MQIKRLIFISMVMLISITCIGIMNLNNDRLSRYPYTDQKDRALIEKHLSNEEIEYIIEYVIQPSDFIDYIESEQFNIYHASSYKEVHENFDFYTSDDIVKIVEKTFDILSTQQLMEYLIHYDIDSLMHYYDNSYINKTILIKNPTALDAYVDQVFYLSKRKPNDLVLIDQLKTVDDKQVYISNRVQSSLNQMCEAISLDLNLKVCGGLSIDNGYISYEQQEKIYDDLTLEFGDEAILNGFKAGHNEAQLGLSVDFYIQGFEGNRFGLSEQYKWLDENAYKYGFYQSYNEDNQNLTSISPLYNHFRYVGVNAATIIYKSNNKGNINNE